MKTTLIYMLAAAALTACSSGNPSGKQTDTTKSVAENAAPAPAPAPANPIAWTISPVASPITAGKVTNLLVSASIQDGWHIYSITQPAGGPRATRITLPPGQPFTLASDPSPTVAPETKYDDAFRMNVQEHEKAVTFNVPVRMTGARGAGSVHVDVLYQVCNASLCFPPQTAKLAAPVSGKAE